MPKQIIEDLFFSIVDSRVIGCHSEIQVAELHVCDPWPVSRGGSYLSRLHRSIMDPVTTASVTGSQTAATHCLYPAARAGICIYRNMWILLPENTKQLYSLAHVIISLDRGATRFTLFSNTETLSFTESIGKSWLVSYILHLFQSSKLSLLFRFTIVAIAWA